MLALFAVSAVAFCVVVAFQPLFRVVSRQRALKREGWL